MGVDLVIKFGLEPESVVEGTLGHLLVQEGWLEWTSVRALFTALLRVLRLEQSAPAERMRRERADFVQKLGCYTA